MKRGSPGQASVEYIIMLAMVALLAVGVKRALQPVFDRLSNRISGKIDGMFSQGNLHKLPLGR